VPTFVAGDVNGDVHVDVADISAEMSALTNVTAFENNYGPSHLVLNTDELYAVLDQNHDGMINNADVQALIVLLADGGGSAIGGGSFTAVPEPSSIMLVGLGCMMLIAVRVRACSCWHRIN